MRWLDEVIRKDLVEEAEKFFTKLDTRSNSQRDGLGWAP